MYDITIQDAAVIDGAGLPSYQADIAVKGGRIAAIGKFKVEAKQTINARGLTVIPGIIDPHLPSKAQPMANDNCRASPAAAFANARFRKRKIPQTNSHSLNLIYCLKLNSMLKRISLARPHGTAFVCEDEIAFSTGADE